MKLLLDKTDLENLIREKYDGVTEINFGEYKDIEIILQVDSSKLWKREIKVTPILQEPIHKKEEPIKTLEEKNKEEAQKGLMSSGGANRTLMRF